MKRFSEQLHKKATSVKLRAAEKTELRERLLSYMEYHPLSAELKNAKLNNNEKVIEQIVTEPFKVLSIPFATIFKYSSAVAALILVVVPFVAERAVPGDTLYAVKVQFNEEIRSTLTFDSFEKVEWETERLNRRIAEARLLASEGLLTEEVEAEVANAVREHTANAQREIEELRTQDADAATLAEIALDTTLEVQADSLKKEDEKSEDEKEEGETTEEVKVSLIASAIDESRSNSAEKPATSTLPVYDKMMARVEQNTTRIYELLASLELVVTTEEFSDFSRRVDDIQRVITEAISLRENDEDEARLKLVEVLQRTQRLIVFMTEIKVIKTVDIEEIIPVVLTDEEEAAERQVAVEELESKLSQIETLIGQLEDEQLLEKILVTKTDIETGLLELASTTLDHESYLAKTEEIGLLADDVLAQLMQQLAPVEEPVIEDVGRASTTEEAVIDEEETATSTEETVIDGEATEVSQEENQTEESNQEEIAEDNSEVVDTQG